MKIVNISLMSILTMSSFVFAGGDIIPSVFEDEVVDVPIEPVAPIVVPPVSPVPKVVTPVVVRPAVIPIVPPKEIAVNGLYVALGLTVARFNSDCTCSNVNSGTSVDKTVGFIGRVGYDFNQYVGVEARGIQTPWQSNGGEIKHIGAFLKPMYPVSKDVNVYALGGYAKTTTPKDLRRVDAKTFAWGGGLEYDLGSDIAKKGLYNRAFDGYGNQENGFGLFADYERLVQKSGSPDLDTLNFGLTYDF